MKKTRTDLPFGAKVVFETPEQLAEIMFAFRNSVTSWYKDIHARSRWLAGIDDLENGIDKNDN